MNALFRACAASLLCAMLAASSAYAGKIPGLPVPLPPGREARLHYSWENDFLGRGGEFDDQRTQQISLDMRLGERWHLVADHSILTNRGPAHDATDPPGLEGRLDEWSLSLARRWQNHTGRLFAGAGLRGVDDLEGARIQNGFHRLVGSEIVDLPYLSTRRTDPIGWLIADREDLRPVGTHGWKSGSWVRTAGLLAGGGRVDASVSALGLLRRRAFELRLGLQADWREGSRGNIVESAAAESERGLFGVFGLGLGPLELESYQRVDGGSAYGRAVWRSGPASEDPSPPPGHYALSFGLRLPETAWRAGAAWSPPGLELAARSGGRLMLTLDYLAGESPDGNSVERFRVERQLTCGLAWRDTEQHGWIAPLAGLGLGWRREWLDGDGALAGTRSDLADRAVLAGEMGADLRMTELSGHGLLTLRLSLTCHVPLGDAEVAFAGREHQLQRPGAGVATTVVYAISP